MENIIFKIVSITGIKMMSNYSSKYFLSQRCYSTSPREMMNKPKIRHPYRKIHPWKSLENFSQSLVAGIVYNEGGLVAVNKPYGISGRPSANPGNQVFGIVNCADYTLSEAAPLVASALGYPELKLLKTPEKYTSGVAIFVANETVAAAVEKSLARARGMSVLAKTYWIVTTRVHNQIKGEMRLAMRMEQGPTKGIKQPVIVTSWSQQEEKTRQIKILNVQFKVISNSTKNLSSLIEIKSSTTKWHALRLFASTVLYSPILGDYKYGSRVKNVMGKWMSLSPFVEAAREPPKLSDDLLALLKLSANKELTIPAHIHLREIYLPMFLAKNHQVVLTAPLMPEFEWTCQQLEFKHNIFKNDEITEIRMNQDSNSVSNQAVP